MGKSLSEIIQDRIVSEQREKRDYIGASGIGNECERAIWYQYKHPEYAEFSNKQLLTFEVGHTLEKMVIKLLRECGLEIITGNEDNNNLEFYDKEVPVFKGHLDAVLEREDGDHAIIEIKTARNSSFNVFKKNGLLEWSPTYYAQMQSYMGMTGIHEGYLIALNKDTTELYDQHVTFDEIFYYMLKAKAQNIFKYITEPKQINKSPMFYKCKACSFLKKCHKNVW